MRRNAVAYFARIVIEQVCRGDLEVVIGSVGKASASIAVAKRPYAGNGSAQLFIDRDVAVLVGCKAGGLEAKIVGVGTPANGSSRASCCRSPSVLPKAPH